MQLESELSVGDFNTRHRSDSELVKASLLSDFVQDSLSGKFSSASEPLTVVPLGEIELSAESEPVPIEGDTETPAVDKARPPQICRSWLKYHFLGECNVLSPFANAASLYFLPTAPYYFVVM